MASLKDKVLEQARKQHSEIVEIRRDIHAHPEIGFEVERTAEIAAKEMESLGLKIRRGVGKTGVLADLIVDPAAPTVALRADMDALPMQELGASEYKSKIDGRAHMCGHDSHTAMLIGAARVISKFRESLKVNIRFLFQPNEENLPGGAPAMIQDGALDQVREIYGIHVWPTVESGKIAVAPGPAMAQPDTFELKIFGKGGHAALPHLTVDPVVIAAQIVTQAQALVSRTVDPLDSAVISFTQIHTGSTHNVIPDRALIVGTIRTLSAQVQKDLQRRFEALIQGICNAAGARYELDYELGYPVTLNHDEPTRNVVEQAKNLLGQDQVIYPFPPVMGGEDFGYYLQEIPGCFYFLGVGNEAKGTTKMCHHPEFNIDEDAMLYGVVMHALLALSQNP